MGRTIGMPAVGLCAVFFMAAQTQAAQKKDQADWVFKNGRVYHRDKTL